MLVKVLANRMKGDKDSLKWALNFLFKEQTSKQIDICKHGLFALFYL